MFGSTFWLTMITAGTLIVTPATPHYRTTTLSFAAIQSRNSITGSVYNESRLPIENLRVELLDEVDGTLASARTDGGGRYAFYGLSSGTFQVRVLTVGTEYQGKTERVTIIGALLGGRSSTSEQLDIILPYKKSSKSNSPPGSVFVQEVPPAARQLYDQAVKDINDVAAKDKGIKGLQKSIELFPDFYDALELLGQEYIKREEYAVAQQTLTRATMVNPRDYASWYALGYAQYKLRLLTESIQSLEKSASFNPNSANTYLLLGTLQRIQKQWEPAEKHLKRAKSLSKKPIADIHWQLALLYNETARHKEAADELETFLKIQPDTQNAEKIRKLIDQLRKK